MLRKGYVAAVVAFIVATSATITVSWFLRDVVRPYQREPLAQGAGVLVAFAVSIPWVRARTGATSAGLGVRLIGLIAIIAFMTVLRIELRLD